MTVTRRQKTGAWLAACFLSIIFLSGCGPSEQKKLTDYFNATAKITKDVDTALNSLQNIGKQMDTKNPDFKAIQKSLKDQVDNLEKKKAEFEAVPVPDSAKNLHQFQLDGFEIAKQAIVKSSDMIGYVEQALALMNKDFKKMKPKEAMDIANQAKALQKKTQALKLELDAISKKAIAQDGKISSEQQRLAKENNITLK